MVTSSHNWVREWTLEWKFDFNIYDPMPKLEKKSSSTEQKCLYIMAYFTWKLISTFLYQFYPENLANFAGSAIIFFINAALIIQWFDQIVALSWWVLLLLLPILLALFFCHKFMCALFIETFALSWEITRGRFLKMFFVFE